MILPKSYKSIEAAERKRTYEREAYRRRRADYIASMTPEQKEECGEQLMRQFLAKLK